MRTFQPGISEFILFIVSVKNHAFTLVLSFYDLFDLSTNGYIVQACTVILPNCIDLVVFSALHFRFSIKCLFEMPAGPSY